MRLLDYLIWLGEVALKPNKVFHTLAKVADKLIKDYYESVLEGTKQIFLMTATGKWLDRWGWDFVRLRRRFGEDDDSYRMRILQALFRLRATRRALWQVIQYTLKKPPIELYEPIRDSAFWDFGDFYLSQAERNQPNLSAAIDGSGHYCGRFGTLGDTSFTGRVRVNLPESSTIGAGLQFFNGLDFYDRGAFLLSGKRQRLPLQSEFLNLIEETITTGTQVSVEFS